MLKILSFLILANWTSAFYPITLPSRMLVSHVYRSLQDCDWLNCIQACQDDPRCISYNFIHSTHDHGVCEMIDCGLEDFCDIKRQLVFSHGTLFQQLAWPGGREICESSNTRVGRKDFSLLFPTEGADGNFVQKRGMPHLPKLSVCFWMKASSRHPMTIFSYLGTKGTKELMIILMDANRVELTLGGESKAISVAINDGDWHHICTTWDNADGSWAFFKDGVVVSNGSILKADHVIPSGGSLVLGQEQITDKTFEPRPFIGELGNFNIWSKIVSAIQVSQMSKRCLNGRGSILHWTAFRFGINGKVKIVMPSSCAANAFPH